MGERVLVSITVNRVKDEIVYKLDSASSLTNEELEYYLEQIIDGICKWKPVVCEETFKSYNGGLQKKQSKKVIQ